MIKGGCTQSTVFDTIQFYIDRGLSVDQAVQEVESVLRGKLGEDLIARIKTEFDFRHS